MPNRLLSTALAVCVALAIVGCGLTLPARERVGGAIGGALGATIPSVVAALEESGKVSAATAAQLDGVAGQLGRLGETIGRATTVGSDGGASWSDALGELLAAAAGIAAGYFAGGRSQYGRGQRHARDAIARGDAPVPGAHTGATS